MSGNLSYIQEVAGCSKIWAVFGIRSRLQELSRVSGISGCIQEICRVSGN
ncbi:MAG: hypothetical protein IJS39_15465 [Synergistaceae bacterium]|nr:hypothetical protein [Synergistaceae bacterium]